MNCVDCQMTEHLPHSVNSWSAVCTGSGIIRMETSQAPGSGTYSLFQQKY